MAGVLNSLTFAETPECTGRDSSMGKSDAAVAAGNTRASREGASQKLAPTAPKGITSREAQGLHRIQNSGDAQAIAVS